MLDTDRVASATPIHGVTLRPLRAPADYRPMNAIANAMRAVDGQGWATSDEQFQRAFRNCLRNRGHNVIN